MPSTETTIAIIISVVVLAGVVGLFFRPKDPPTTTFKCARCGVVARYSERTENAWRSGVKRLYCDSCHRQWLRTNPDRATATHGGNPRPSGRGCFTIMLVLVLVPAALYVAAWYA